ncbi:transposase, partial [Streptomyces sp. NPDC051636]|uniref:transposase n=1 Tax=Streptomyces sp. NPDC051636 TaxID=3365663 RepID=UPI00378D2B92
IVDSTPVECGRSKETVKRSDLAGWAEYGYCASHSRFFWGLRLHLIRTPHGLPVAFALAGAKAVECDVLLDIFATEPDLLHARPGQTLLADKNYYGRQFEQQLAEQGVRLLRPARKGETPPSSARPARACTPPRRMAPESSPSWETAVVKHSVCRRVASRWAPSSSTRWRR